MLLGLQARLLSLESITAIINGSNNSTEQIINIKQYNNVYQRF